MRRQHTSTRRTGRLPLEGVRALGGVPKGHLRVGPLMSIPRLLRESGIDPASVLADCGLDTASFDDPENTIAFSAGCRLLGLCAECTGIAHFGLAVAQSAPAESMGTVGYLALSSSTVGVALGHLVTHLNLHDRGGIARLRRDGEHAVLGYATIARDVENADQVYALAIAMAQNIMRGLCGAQWRPTSVTLPFRRPRDVAPYRAYFGVTPLFDAQEAAIVFAARVLETPLAGADAFLNRLMQERAASASRSDDDDFAEDVRKVLRAQATSSKGTIADVAAAMGRSERAVSRQLAELGTSFREIREVVWYDVARELLTYSTTPISDIALTLGYADPAAFTRAFARWSGTTPSRWRRERRIGQS